MRNRIEKQEETVALLVSKAKVQGKSERSNMHDDKNYQSKKHKVGRGKDKSTSYKCYKCGGVVHVRKHCSSMKDEAFAYEGTLNLEC